MSPVHPEDNADRENAGALHSSVPTALSHLFFAAFLESVNRARTICNARLRNVRVVSASSTPPLPERSASRNPNVPGAPRIANVYKENVLALPANVMTEHSRLFPDVSDENAGPAPPTVTVQQGYVKVEGASSTQLRLVPSVPRTNPNALVAEKAINVLKEYAQAPLADVMMDHSRLFPAVSDVNARLVLMMATVRRGSVRMESVSSILLHLVQSASR